MSVQNVRARDSKENKVERCSICNKEILNVNDLGMPAMDGNRSGMCPTCSKAWLIGMRAGMEKKDVPNDVDQRYVDQYERISKFDMTPREIISELDSRIVGQEDAKRSLSLATRRHYRRAQVRMIGEDERADEMPKENILLIGPTGSGKTFLSQNISKIVGVPFWRQALTSFTEAGYVGSDVENLLSSLLISSGRMTKLAESGILFLDEVDKKARRTTDHMGSPRDVSGVGVQQALLEMCDSKGAIVNVSVTGANSKGHPMRVTTPVNTRDIMFIFSGAFSDGLSDIIAKRLGKKKRIGFSGEMRDVDLIMEEADILHEVQHEDLEEYGFITEFCGRLGMIVTLDPLSQVDMKKIMLDIDGSVIKRLQLLADVEGFKLEFTDEAIDEIVGRCYRSGMGARRLSSMCVQCTEHIFLDLPDRVRDRKGKKKISVKVTDETVKDPSSFEVS